MNSDLLQSIQPYFVLSADSAYEKSAVHRNGIAHFYRFTTDSATEAVNVVPDASADIIVKLDADNPEAWVCGSWKQPGKTLFEQGASYFGVRYQIGAVPDFLSLPPKELIDQRLALVEVFAHTDSLLESLTACEDFHVQIAAFSHWCGDPEIDDIPPSVLCESLAQLILSRRGNIRVAELCEDTGFSPRAINRAFSEYYGYSPKAFCLILRYQHVLSQLTHQQFERLTDLAADSGYADQSHFLHEFKRYNGQGPKQFKTPH